METLKNNEDIPPLDMGKKVLIATLYNKDAVLLAAHRLSVDRLILLLNEEADKTQKESLEAINNSLGQVIDVTSVKIKVYDIVAVAKKSVEIIDMLPKEDTVYVNITQGRKTMALGLLYGAYCRIHRVKKIGYNPTDEKDIVVYLPKLSIKLTDSQGKVLEAVEKYDGKSITEMATKVDLSTAMFYRAFADLKEQGYVTEESKLMMLGRLRGFKMELKPINKQLVNEYILQFKEEYSEVDKAIETLVNAFPLNDKYENVLLKATVINRLYSTNIFQIHDMARHIFSLKNNLDTRLKEGDLNLVNDIANSNKKRVFYSFATKYCAWHNRKSYVLYDSYVHRLLLAYNKKDHFDDFKSYNLKDYLRFMDVIKKFMRFYDIESFSFKEIDMFLWIYGKGVYNE